jgi:hypothetical protein
MQQALAMAQDVNGLVSSRGRWIFPVDGGEVTQVRIDYAFGLVIETYDDRRASTHVRISSAFDFETAGRTLRIDPERTAEMAPLLSLHKAIVEEAFAIKDGHLVIGLGSAGVIRVAPDDKYEAWAVSGHMPPIERKFNVIGLPSGGVAVM